MLGVLFLAALVGQGRAAPSWPVVVAPNAELLAVAELRGRSIRLQVDTGSAVSWVAADRCWLRTLNPSTHTQSQAGTVEQRATLPLDVVANAHRDACEALAEGGARIGQLWKGASIVVQRSEALVAACIDHRGKQWKDVRAKRGSRLGTSGVVTALDSAAGRLAVKVRFDKDGESMWWRPEFLSLASVPLGGSVNPPPDVVPPRWGSEPAEQECLQLHYADETDVHGGCAVLNLTYASPRGGRGNLGGALFGVARWIGEQVELTEGFDRAELAWDGMLGLAPPHAKHRPFEQRWASRGLERPPEGRVSHSLVESMLLRKRAKANSPQEYEGVTFTLALGPWHTAASMQATRPMGRYQDGRPWTADEAAADVGAVPGLLKLGASHLGESAQGMGSTGLVDILPQSDGTRYVFSSVSTELDTTSVSFLFAHFYNPLGLHGVKARLLGCAARTGKCRPRV